MLGWREFSEEGRLIVTDHNMRHWMIVIMGILLPVAMCTESAAGPAERGKDLFEQKCLPCHTVGGGRKVGPDLKGVTRRREAGWLLRWIANSEEMIRSGDPIAQEVIKGYAIKMPSTGLSDEQIRDVLAHLDEAETRPSPAAPAPLAVERKRRIDFLSRTYAQFLQDARGNRYGPISERLDLDLRDLGNTWSFRSSGLFRYDLRTTAYGKREMDELTYAYATFTPNADQRLAFTLGRQYAFGGIAAEHLDGVHARMDLARGTGLSLFGGRPVETGLDGKQGDFILGGRMSQRIGSRAEIGVSYLKEDNDGARFREEAGLDVWLLPSGMVELQGHSFWNSITRGWMEHAYNVRIPFEQCVITGIYSRTEYGNAFSARTMSAFSPDLLGRDEGLTKVGASADISAGKGVSVVLAATRYSYRITGDAWYYGGSVTAAGGGTVAGVSLRRMEGPSGRLRYIESRAYAKKGVSNWIFAMDALNLHYDEPFSGLRNAYSFSGAATYKITRDLSAGADVDYSRNPDLTRAVMVLMKLVYNFRKEL